MCTPGSVEGTPSSSSTKQLTPKQLKLQEERRQKLEKEKEEKERKRQAREQEKLDKERQKEIEKRMKVRVRWKPDMYITKLN